MSRCTNCSFCWADGENSAPRCHFESLGAWDPAPCEFDNRPRRVVGIDEDGYEIYEED